MIKTFSHYFKKTINPSNKHLVAFTKLTGCRTNPKILQSRRLFSSSEHLRMEIFDDPEPSDQSKNNTRDDYQDPNSENKNTHKSKQQRIQDILNSLDKEKDTIELNKPKRVYSGSLKICPTPIGNMEDLTLNVFNALNKADIIACEDKRVAQKLFLQMEKKELGKKFRSEFEGYAEDFDFDADPDIFGDPENEEEKTEHPNLFEIRREKRRLKELKVQKEAEELLTNSKNLLRDLDSLTFYSTKFDEKSESSQNNFYDSTQRQKASKSSYGLDDPYMQELKEAVERSKTLRNRGLLMVVHKYNESSRIPKLVKAVKGGLDVALITDAGTPCISDPGQMVVNACLQEGLSVEGFCGPSAIDIALKNANFSTESITFQGYLSKKKFMRENELVGLKQSGKTAVFFESKYRILTTLRSIERIYGPEHEVYVGVELTKMFERNLRGMVKDIYDAINVNPEYAMPSFKGELTVVIAPCEDVVELSEEELIIRQRNQKRFKIRGDDLCNLLKDNLELDSVKQTAEILRSVLGVSKSEAYKLASEQSPKKMIHKFKTSKGGKSRKSQDRSLLKSDSSEKVDVSQRSVI